MTAAQQLDGKRQYRRLPSIVPVDFQLLSESGEPLEPEVRTGFTQDLSRGGLRLRLTSVPTNLEGPLDESSKKLQIAVDVTLPDRVLRVVGRVVWSQKLSAGGKTHRLVGVQFTGLSDDDSRAIESYAARAIRRSKIVKTALIVLPLLVLGAAGLYAWSAREHRQELSEVKQELAATQTRQEREIERLERVYLRVRWFVGELETIAHALEGNGTEVDHRLEPEIVGPAIEDLAGSVERLRQLVKSQPAAEAPEAATINGPVSPSNGAAAKQAADAASAAEPAATGTGSP